MLLCQKKITLPSSVDNVEAMVALHEGYITFAHEMDLSSIIIEGDSEVVVKTLRSEGESFVTYGHLLASEKSLTGL